MQEVEERVAVNLYFGIIRRNVSLYISTISVEESYFYK